MTGICPFHFVQVASSVMSSAMKWATLIRLVFPELKMALRVGEGFLGQMAMESGRLRDAKRYLRETLRFAPDDAGLWMRLADVLVQVARCCDPLPGEAITGLVSQGSGVTVHSLTVRSFGRIAAKKTGSTS